MKHELTFVFVSVGIAMQALSARADSAGVVYRAPEANTIGVDGVAVLPIGDYSHAANAGVGALGRVEVPTGFGYITGRAGVIAHVGTAEDVSLTLVPIYAGYRVPVGTGGGYVAGELGVTLAFGSVATEIQGMTRTATASDSELGLTLAVGLRRGSIDVRAGLFAPDVGNAVGVMASAGVDFASF